MAYKPGVAIGESVTLLIGSIALLGLYITCSALDCVAIPSSYGSPIWTGVLVLATSFVGMFMSSTKSEKGCGVFFLILSIFCVLATLACMGLTLFASFLELLSPLSSTNTLLSFSITTTVATNTTQATFTSLNPVTGFILWIVMMTMAFILLIVACVTSCQYCCCCQERVIRQETFLVLQQGGTHLSQNIFVENNTILSAPQGPAPQIVLFPNGPPSNAQFVQQPFQGQQVFAIPTAPQQSIGHSAHPPPPYAAQSTASYSSPSQNVTLALPQTQQQIPSPSAPPISHNSLVNRWPQQSTAAENQAQNHQQSITVNQSTPVVGITDNVGSNTDYQPLIHDAHQTSSGIQPGYEQPQENAPQDVHPGISHTYIQAAGRSDAEDDDSYLEPDRDKNVETSDLNSRLYEYIEEPSYDYVNPQSEPKDILSGETNADYVNENIGRRPRARTPTK